MKSALLTALLAAVAAPAATANCRVSAEPMMFAPTGPVRSGRQIRMASVSTLSLVQITCSGLRRETGYRLHLQSADGAAGGQWLRHVSNPERMRVLLFKDAAFSQPWGNGTGGGSPMAGSAPAGDSRQTYVVFGRIPPEQGSLQPGRYQARWTVRLEYVP